MTSATPLGALTFEDFARAIEDSEGLRSVVEYTYRTLTESEETENFTVSNRGSDPLKVVALPPRVMELQIGVAVSINGKTVPTVPSSVIVSLIMGVLKGAGNSDKVVQAAGRVFGGGQQRGNRLRTPEEEADISRVARAISSVQSPTAVVGLRTLLKRARDDKYVPFVVPETPLSSGQIVVVAFKRGQQARQNYNQYLRAIAMGRFRVRQKIHLGGKYSTHIYISPPPGSYIVASHVPTHWPPEAATSSKRGNLWHLYIGLTGKHLIWAQRDKKAASPHGDEWYANAEFSTQRMLHVVLAIAFTTLTVGSAVLGHVRVEDVPGRLMPLNALVATMVLPLLWASREHDLQLAYLSAHGFLAAMLATAWLAVKLSGASPISLIVVGGVAAGFELVLAAASRSRN